MMVCQIDFPLTCFDPDTISFKLAVIHTGLASANLSHVSSILWVPEGNDGARLEKLRDRVAYHSRFHSVLQGIRVGPADRAKMTEVFRRHGMRVAGPPPAK
jgi:hypothetical protein